MVMAVVVRRLLPRTKVEDGRRRGLLSAAVVVVLTPLVPSVEPRCAVLFVVALVSLCVACESQFVMMKVNGVLVSVHPTSGMLLLVES